MVYKNLLVYMEEKFDDRCIYDCNIKLNKFYNFHCKYGDQHDNNENKHSKQATKYQYDLLIHV